MLSNLTSTFLSTLAPGLARQASPLLGEQEGATREAINTIVPATIGTLAQAANQPDAANRIYGLVNDPDVPTGVDGGHAWIQSQMEDKSALFRRGEALTTGLFGPRTAGFTEAVAARSGLSVASATKLIPLVVPFILGYLKGIVRERRLDAVGFATFLGAERNNLAQDVDPRVATALGLERMRPARRAPVGRRNPAVFLAPLAGALLLFIGVRNCHKQHHVGTAQTTGGVVQQTETTPPAEEASPAAGTGPVTAQAPANEPTSVFFEVNKFNLNQDANGAIEKAAEEYRANPKMKLLIAGYTDRTGSLDHNNELARNRAKEVRVGLVARGVPESAIIMSEPRMVMVGAPGDDQRARRVDIFLTK
jgi:outer membrane protein OmpA-like peptidoglycan-associated protein